MRNSFSKHALTTAVLLALVASTAFAADAPKSALVVPERFAWAPSDTAAAMASDSEFWRSFGDPMLTSLVDRALRENHDLRIAYAHYEGANALLRGARFDQLPTVTASASASDNRLSADQAPGLSRNDRDGKSYDIGAHLSWELDLFGRVRHGVQAQRADTDAVARDLQAMQVTIVAEVATDYIQLRGLQERLRVAQDNAASQAETLRLVEAGFSAGHGTEFDTARARSQLESTGSRVPALKAEIAATMHHLAILTGQAPEALISDLQPPQPMPALPPGVDPGTPGELLRRRPDVAAAESRLESATARIGVARADLFPRFTLGGLIGGQAVNAGSLFNRDGESHFVALGIDWSFLDVGRVRARLAAAHADADGELARYQQTVLRALEETENALVRYDNARAEDQQLTSAAIDSVKAAQLARIRYEAGAADLFEVLDAERSNLQAQDASAQGRTRTFTDLIGVYKALAGGWPTQLPAKVTATADGAIQR